MNQAVWLSHSKEAAENHLLYTRTGLGKQNQQKLQEGFGLGSSPGGTPWSPVLHFGFSDSSAWKYVTNTNSDALEATAVHFSLEEQSKRAWPVLQKSSLPELEQGLKDRADWKMRFPLLGRNKSLQKMGKRNLECVPSGHTWGRDNFLAECLVKLTLSCKSKPFRLLVRLHLFSFPGRKLGGGKQGGRGKGEIVREKYQFPPGECYFHEKAWGLFFFPSGKTLQRKSPCLISSGKNYTYIH